MQLTPLHKGIASCQLDTVRRQAGKEVQAGHRIFVCAPMQA